MAAGLKRVARAPLAWLLSLISRCSSRRAGVVVVYHRVGDPHEDPDARLMPALGSGAFEGQIRHLQRRYAVVPASRILKASAARRRWQRFPVAITFDDDAPSHTAAAMPVLARRGVPATFFLSGASLDRPFAFWYERLQTAYDRGLVRESSPLEGVTISSGGPNRPPIHRLAEAIKALPPDRYDRVADELLRRLGADPAESAMPRSEVRRLVDAGFEVGFHTRGHYILPKLDDASLARELSEGREELAALADAPLAMIAYPNGDADQRVANAARAAGYKLGFTTDPLPVTPQDDPLLVGRVDPPHHPATSRFALRVACVLRQAPSG